MHSEDLVRMANQIARFFAPYPEAEALEGVRDHLKKFWTPAMRRDLVEVASNGDGADGMHPLVRRAVDKL